MSEEKSSGQLDRWKSAAFDIVDGSALGVFRILWGLIMVLEARWLWNHLEDFHSDRYFHYSYPGFSWIRHFPQQWMTELEIAAMLVAAILMAVGLAFRPAAIIFFLGYAHLFFSEAAAFNNHFYLIILITGILLFTKADAYNSLRQWRRGKKGLKDEGVPRWNYLLLQFQIVVVYVYGAITKLNHDWFLEQEPVRFWLQHTRGIPAFFRNIVEQERFAWLAAYGGFAIDLICPFLLFHKTLRIPAAAVLILFHLINSQLFSIGFFPIIGIALLVLVLPPNTFRKDREQHPVKRSQGKISKPVLVIALTYCTFQLLFPLRWCLAKPTNPLWTEVGHRFAWRMMLQSRFSDLNLRFSNPDVETWLQQNPTRYPRLSRSNSAGWLQSSEFVWQYTKALHQALDQHGMGDTEIYAHFTVSMNGRPFYPAIDPHVDLARADRPLFGVPDWIPPLPAELEIDFDQVMPPEDHPRLSWEAMKKISRRKSRPRVAILHRKTK